MPAPQSYLLVDGHSVLHAWPELRRDQLSASRRHLARTELLKRLRHYQDMSGTQVVVVFDGTQATMTEEREPQGLQIIYAHAGQSADLVLERLAARYAGQQRMSVVSADGMVGETVMAFGADWLSPEMLKGLCERAEAEISQQLTRRRRVLLALCAAGLGLPKTQAKAAVSASAFEKAAEYSARRGGHALLIRQHGEVVHESYANGAKRSESRRIYSGTKGFWGLAAMAAVEDGLIRLQDKVADALPEWRESGGKSIITVEQLLDFTGGLERGLILHEDGLKNRNLLALRRPLVASPGSAFIYGPSQLQVFHEFLKRRLLAKGRRESPTRYLEKRVLKPMGLGSQRYLPDAAGNPLLAAGFMMTAAQWSRMGELLRQAGAPVLSPSSFRSLIEGSKANAAYSFGFWNNRAAGKEGAREVDVEDQLDLDWNRQSWRRVCLCRQAPPDLLACIGSGYQRLFVLPSRGLVIVRQGQNARFSDATFLRTVFAA